MTYNFDFNLAFLKYRNCVGPDKPFTRIETRKIAMFDGEIAFEALSEVNKDLKLIDMHPSVVYGTSFSCGTDSSKVVAVFKCISEGLERWAYLSTFEKGLRKLRFDANPTSTGFAAYPGILKNRVRSIAKYEALERWAIINWWRGKVKSRICEVRKFREGVLTIHELACDTEKFFVSLLHYQFNSTEFDVIHAYSFAAGSTFNFSVQKAKVELDRNINSLKRFKNAKFEEAIEIVSVEDARLIYFSRAEGNDAFQKKIKYSQGVDTNFSDLEVIVDCEVKGDWNNFATVWRYLFKNSHCDDNDHNFFFF
jgi:hypothetical protein